MARRVGSALRREDYPKTIQHRDQTWYQAPSAADRIGVGLPRVYQLVTDGRLQSYEDPESGLLYISGSSIAVYKQRRREREETAERLRKVGRSRSAAAMVG